MQKFQSIGRCVALWAATLTLILLAGCSKDDNGSTPQVYLAPTTVNSNATEPSTPVRIVTWGGDTGAAFTAAIVAQSGDEPWCSFASFTSSTDAELTAAGRIGYPLNIYVLENPTDTPRTATIRVDFASGASQMLTLTQLAYSSTPFFDRLWGEQPAYRANSSYIYKTYYTTLNYGGNVRNFTVCFDTSLRVSHWVAYPMTANYVTPAFNRPTPEPWSYDPNDQQPVIPQSAQFDVSMTYGSGDARGHQCPSADRYSTTATNAMTYYATNIMPQNYDFNGGIWAQLENKVRENMRLHRQDTVFVVTGAYFDGRMITVRDGKKIGYPANCWKVLLRSSSGKRVWESSAEDLRGIGFWFTNDNNNGTSLREHATTIADIEAKTGFTFFRNIPADAAAKVKSQNNPEDWSL